MSIVQMGNTVKSLMGTDLLEEGMLYIVEAVTYTIEGESSVRVKGEWFPLDYFVVVEDLQQKVDSLEREVRFLKMSRPIREGRVVSQGEYDVLVNDVAFLQERNKYMAEVLVKMLKGEKND